MNTLKDWINKVQKQDGTYLAKDRLIQEIRKCSKASLPVEYKPGTEVLLVAIPVSSSYKI